MKRWRYFIALMLFAAPLRADEVLQEITVNAGDTMWSIANKFLKDPQKWPDIVKYNKLPTADPTMALPGIKIKVPVMLIKEEFRNAELVRMTPEVRYKRKAESDWHPATPLMTLGYEDSLRTMKGGDARVRFPTREEVQINENSLVVLKPEKILQEVEILQGDIRASRAKVIMPSGTIVKPRIASDYHAKVRADMSEVVFVYKGEVDVTAQGKTVRVPEGYGTEVIKSAPPSNPAPLPSFKDFDPVQMTAQAPATGFEAPVRSKTMEPPNRGLNAPQTIGAPRPVSDGNPATAAPAPQPGKAKALVSENLMVSYKVQLAKDPKFTEILLEHSEKIGQNFDIKKADIPDGTYVMRLAFIDAFGVQSPWSSPTEVIRDTIPPVITDLSPKDNQRFTGDESYCDVVGNVSDAAMVAVNGQLVFLTNGRFTKFVNLTEGMNKITVVARDSQGNETVMERMVEYHAAPQQSH
jgi:hypothetical protein